MSRTIYLVRHGEAEPASGDGRDADRALTADGRRKMRGVGLGLKRLGVAPDTVLSSPLRRAEETAAELVKAMTLRPRIEIEPLLAPGHEPPEVLKGLRPHRAARELMLVGHEPDMGRLASYLLAPSAGLAGLPFKKGAVAAIGVEAIPPRSPGMLLWFMTAKQLRAVGAGRSKKDTAE
jgi:phosphohistidine phosphatase